MTPHLLIRGGRPLTGEVPIGGMKNAALPILFATLLVRGNTILHHLPPVTDIQTTLSILQFLGAEIDRLSPTAVRICTNRAEPLPPPMELTRTLRGSAYLLGAGTGRFGAFATGLPGGCDFGTRPLDQHFKLLELLGAQIEPADNRITICAPKGLHGGNIRLDFPSVGATANGILAAVSATGKTVIANAAREPHIVDLANFLNACGAKITGAGSSKIVIEGGTALHGATYSVIPDMIEAGTYLCAVCGTGGRITLQNVIPRHLAATVTVLEKMGAEISVAASSLTAERVGPFWGTVLKTAPYPGFPTDMQPQFAPLFCIANSGGRIYERVWANRFQYTAELKRMGGRILQKGDCAVFPGGDRLTGTRIRATDLRGGAAMLIAGLCAEGTTELYDMQHLERGYPDFVGKLSSLGADISYVKE